jgi:hypothetical protein
VLVRQSLNAASGVPGSGLANGVNSQGRKGYPESPVQMFFYFYYFIKLVNFFQIKMFTKMEI